jgi:hypothetical protein
VAATSLDGGEQVCRFPAKQLQAESHQAGRVSATDGCMARAQPLRNLEHWRILEALALVVWHGDTDTGEPVVEYVHRARGLGSGSLLVDFEY